MQALTFLLEPNQRDLASGRVHASVGNLAQPGADPCIGGFAIDLESFGAELTRQRHVKARAQVTDEALDLALGLCPIGVDPFRWTVLGIKEEGVPNAKKSSTVCT